MPRRHPKVTCSDHDGVGLIPGVPGAPSLLPPTRATGLARPARSTLSRTWASFLALASALFFVPSCWANGPFFVTYTASMAEPGELEIALKNVAGKPKGGDRFMGSVLEFEYGATS